MTPGASLWYVKDELGSCSANEVLSACAAPPTIAKIAAIRFMPFHHPDASKSETK